MFEWTAHYLDAERKFEERTLDVGWYLVGQPITAHRRDAQELSPGAVVLRITQIDPMDEAIAQDLATFFNERAALQVGV